MRRNARTVISCKKLWKALIDRDMLKKDLLAPAGVGRSSMTKPGHNGNVRTIVKRRTVTAEIPCNIETVWDIVTDNRNYAWRSDLSKIEIVDEKRFDEYTKSGFVTHFCIAEREPYRIYRFDMANRNMSGRWTGIFERCENGTKIAFTEEIQVKNPIMNLFVSGYLKKQQNTYIADLKRAAEKIGESK